MNWLEALILGIVQGATEFLPVSSSGHLVLVSWWLGLDVPPLIYSVTVHLGTTTAILIYFWHDWWNLLQAGIHSLRSRNFNLEQNPQLKLLVFLIIGTIPAAILGILVADYFEEVFATPLLTSFNLFITAGLLIYGEWATRHHGALSANQLENRATDEMSPADEHPDLSWKDVLIIGSAQAMAIMPGISRSGSTIAAGMARGLTRSSATRFSFLLATPIIIAAGAKQALDLLTSDVVLADGMETVLAIGYVSSAIVGYICIVLLLRLVRRYGFYGFAVYCVVFGMLSLGGVLVRG